MGLEGGASAAFASHVENIFCIGIAHSGDCSMAVSLPSAAVNEKNMVRSNCSAVSRYRCTLFVALYIE